MKQWGGSLKDYRRNVAIVEAVNRGADRGAVAKRWGLCRERVNAIVRRANWNANAPPPLPKCKDPEPALSPEVMKAKTLCDFLSKSRKP